MNNHLIEIWQQMLERLSKDLNKPSFETWFNLTRPISLENNCFIIEVPNDFTKDWFETRYCEQIVKALNDITYEQYKVKFTIASDFPATSVTNPEKDPFYPFPLPDDHNLKTDHPFQQISTAKTASDNPSTSSQHIKQRENYHFSPGFNSRYTFDTFVVGACNRLSHAASLAVSESPARAYNPLFIYGGVGLGKTHLLHAIGQYSLFNHSFSKVFYCSSEKFTNDFINSIRDNKTLEFRNKYRNMDILLIDDIQFIAGKEQTQEEFFHTFNALHDNNKQLIISSDRPPKEIPTLEDRLRSRFEWGLITDLQPPDLETRTAILKKKALSDGIDIPDQVIEYLADKVVTNIRELEGALIRIVAHASLSEAPITLELTESALKDIIFTRHKSITIKTITNVTAASFDVSVEDVLSKKRTQNIAQTRQIAMYLCRMLTDLSLPKIGNEFGGRDHTTVLHAFKKIDAMVTKDNDFKHRLEVIKNDILDNS